MNSQTILGGLAAVVLVAVSACAESIAGHANPVPGAGGSASGEVTSTRSSPASSTKVSGSLEDTDPCSLLSRSEAEQAIGPIKEEPAPEKTGTSRGCVFSPNRASFSVGIRTNAGLAGVRPNGGEIKDITIGRHQAKQLVDATGSCGIFLGVTPSSRVEVVWNGQGDPCPPALKIAELVEPKLP